MQFTTLLLLGASLVSALPSMQKRAGAPPQVPLSRNCTTVPITPYGHPFNRHFQPNETVVSPFQLYNFELEAGATSPSGEGDEAPLVQRCIETCAYFGTGPTGQCKSVYFAKNVTFTPPYSTETALGTFGCYMYSEFLHGEDLIDLKDTQKGNYTLAGAYDIVCQ